MAISPPVHADVVEIGERVDVDQYLGAGEAELHHRQQAVAAGHDTRLGAVLLEQRECVIHGRGARRIRTAQVFARFPPSVGRHAPTCRSRIVAADHGRVESGLSDPLSRCPHRSMRRRRSCYEWVRDADPARGLRAGRPARFGEGCGRALGVSEPAVSAALAALRKHLGDPLITPSSQGMALSGGGQRLVGIASQMINLAAEAEAAFPLRPRCTAAAAGGGDEHGRRVRCATTDRGVHDADAARRDDGRRVLVR